MSNAIVILCNFYEVTQQLEIPKQPLVLCNQDAHIDIKNIYILLKSLTSNQEICIKAVQGCLGCKLSPMTAIKQRGLIQYNKLNRHITKISRELITQVMNML